jgi:hypothetical protein
MRSAFSWRFQWVRIHDGYYYGLPQVAYNSRFSLYPSVPDLIAFYGSHGGTIGFSQMAFSIVAHRITIVSAGNIFAPETPLSYVRL